MVLKTGQANANHHFLCYRLRKIGIVDDLSNKKNPLKNAKIITFFNFVRLSLSTLVSFAIMQPIAHKIKCFYPYS